MPRLNKLNELYLITKEIGFTDLFFYAFYQFQLHTGKIRNRTPLEGYPSINIPPDHQPCLDLFSSNWNKVHEENTWSLFQLSSILPNSGSFRPFGGISIPLTLNPPLHQLRHWTEYSNTIDTIDIKKVWEPARFSWAIDLAHTFSINNNGNDAEFFWNKVEEFTSSNPVNCGPNWVSAQEVALRLIAWIIALGAIKDATATTPQRVIKITDHIWQHARRILPTLNYARSQNNNHILSEALGLVFAGDFLQTVTPKAVKLLKKGESEFEQSLLKQIEEDGTYSQHSANYHRMMLQLTLLYDTHLRKNGRKLPAKVKQRLAMATRWLIAQMDSTSGRLPNLGHNDGSLILSLGCREYRDYRPTAQAASLAFLGEPCLPPGPWDLLATWLELAPPNKDLFLLQATSPAIRKVQHGSMWGTLRGVKFHGRPAHVDQLHVDLWWEGINIARDAGTFSYNDPNPWQNALDSTRVHNTVTIDSNDQMTRVGRFLWLDQANAIWESTADPNRISAKHDGYRKIGYVHKRSLELIPNSSFVVTDLLEAHKKDLREHTFTLHWLLPDWKWKFENENLFLNQNNRNILIHIRAGKEQGHSNIEPVDVSLIRGGQTLLGLRQDPILGWESDTYGEKHAALSYSLFFKTAGSIQITTEWKFF